MSHRKTQQEFEEECRELYGNLDDLSFAKYHETSSKVKFVCTKHNIEYFQTPNSHKKYRSCPLCVYENKISRKQILQKDLEHVLKAATEIHNGKYTYPTFTEYVKMRQTIYPVCPKHGVFQISLHNHIYNKAGCPQCKKEALRLSAEKLKEKFREVHGDYYSYDAITDENYVNLKTKVPILCPVCKEYFYQTPGRHLQGSGCQNCANTTSNQELVLTKFLKENKISFIQRKRINNKEFDFLIPEHELALEVNGLRFHNEKFRPNKHYHLNKTMFARSLNKKLIHIFEDDFDKYLPYFKHEILRMCHKLPTPSISNICNISVAKGESFILVYGNDTNYENSDLCYGAFQDDELVSVMAFKKFGENVFELSSFVQKHCYDATHTAKYLFEKFVSDNSPKQIFGTKDLTNDTNDTFSNLGFSLKYMELPDYKWSYGNERFLMSDYVSTVFETKEDETKFGHSMDFLKVYDCGKEFYELCL